MMLDRDVAACSRRRKVQRRTNKQSRCLEGAGHMRPRSDCGFFVQQEGTCRDAMQRSLNQGTSPMDVRTSTWISDWNPEDEKFWNSKGKFIARRNLIWSIVAEHIGFSVWLIWSIVATKLPQAGFHYSTD